MQGSRNFKSDRYAATRQSQNEDIRIKSKGLKLGCQKFASFDPILEVPHEKPRVKEFSFNICLILAAVKEIDFGEI
jgi:hypothetical protein